MNAKLRVPPCARSKGKRLGKEFTTLTQTMLSEYLYGRCLRPFLAHLFEKRDPLAGRQAGKRVIQHTVSVEIDFASIGALEKAEAAHVVEPQDLSDRLF